MPANHRAADPRAHAQGKNLSEFDHVKRGLALVGEEELAEQAADPMFGIKVDGLSDDVKRAMAKLNSADAAQARCSIPRT